MHVGSRSLKAFILILGPDTGWFLLRSNMEIALANHERMFALGESIFSVSVSNNDHFEEVQVQAKVCSLNV